MLTAYHPDYLSNISRWLQVRDCINDRVKDQDSYAQMATLRNAAYMSIPVFKQRSYLIVTEAMQADTIASLKARGVYTNVVGATAEAHLGAAFRVDPSVELPPDIDYLLTDCDGEENGLLTMLKSAVSEVEPLGRLGLLVEPALQRYDEDGNPIGYTKADIANGLGRTYIREYIAEHILDWEVSYVNGKRQLSFVKLMDIDSIRGKGFKREEVVYFRVLYLDENGHYAQQLFEDVELSKPIGQPVIINGYDGKPKQEITFYFVGSVDNSPIVNNAPFYKLSELNVAMYNMDALERHNIFVGGTGTMIVWGDAAQINDQTKGTISVGGGNGLFVGESGGAEILQLDSNNALSAKGKSDLEQMIMLGARLAMPSVQRTAEEARISTAQETSVLSHVIDNVEQAYRLAVKKVGEYMTGQELDITLDMNRDFFDMTLTPQDRAQMLAEYMQGLLPIDDFVAIYKRAGIYSSDRTVEEVETNVNQPRLSFDNGNEPVTA